MNKKSRTEKTLPQLGDRVKDRVSGLTGIVMAVTEWLYGCRTIMVQPESHKEGKPAEGHSFDEHRLEVVAAGAMMPQRFTPVPLDPGGPAVQLPGQSGH